MQKYIWILLAFVLAACSRDSVNQAGGQSIPSSDGAAVTQSLITLEDYGPAPEWENEIWLNTDRPLPLAELRGKVVLLDMWTFG